MNKITCCHSTKPKKKTPKAVIHDAISTGTCVAACWVWFAGFIIDGLFITNMGKFLMVFGGGYVLLWAFANYFYPTKRRK